MKHTSSVTTTHRLLLAHVRGGEGLSLDQNKIILCGKVDHRVIRTEALDKLDLCTTSRVVILEETF